MNIHRLTVWSFILAQLILLIIELGTRYDTPPRQLALAVTNVLTALAILSYDRKLRRQGGQISVFSYLFLAGAVWLDALGNFQHLYASWWWWDRLTHSVGGMALSAGFIDLFLSQRAIGKLTAGWTWTAGMGFLMGQFIGVLYEISEWLGDFWFKTERVRGQYDTSHDLFQNLIGGLLILGIFRLFRRNK